VLHTRIVEALEALAPDRIAEQVERLAHHALRGEMWDKPWHTAGRRGRRPWRSQPTVRPRGISSRYSVPSRIYRRHATHLATPGGGGAGG
jgi:hypothetical protein